MENFIYKLNKYTIKLNKFINNNELIENNYEKYLLYLNKFNYYYNLTGGGKEKGKEKHSDKKATVDKAAAAVLAAAANKHKEKKEAAVATTKSKPDSQDISYNVVDKGGQIVTKKDGDSSHGNIPTDIMDKLKSICKSIKDH